MQQENQSCRGTDSGCHEGHLEGATISCGCRCGSARFDDPSLVSAGGLVPVLALADRAGLRRLAGEQLTVPTDKGAHAGAKVAALVAGMVAGADSIEDMDLLRHGGMGRLFTGVLRAVDAGVVPARVSRSGTCVSSTRSRPGWWPTWPRRRRCCRDAARIAYLDVDDTIRATYGYAKQGAGYGYSGVKGLNALLAALSTPVGGAGDRRDPAAEGVGELRPRRRPPGRRRAEDQPGVRRERAAGRAGGLGVLRPRRDRRRPAGHGARFSVTARQDPAVRRAIASIAEDAWTTIRYPRAVFDEQLQQWVSDAQVAEIPFTAFASRGRKHGRHRPVDRAPRPRRQPRPPSWRTSRASCSRPGATTPCSPTRP